MNTKNRLKEIVDLSYKILFHKIKSGNIKVYNEASMQLQLGVILKQVGDLYVFYPNEVFNIELEKWIDLTVKTVKSPQNKARCDIWLELGNEVEKASAAIELKYFKYTHTEATTDNRFSLILDIQNLENYQSSLGYAIVYTNNENYTKDDIDTHATIKLAPYITQSVQRILKKKTEIVNVEVKLKHQYEANWVKYPPSPGKKTGNYFLKIELDKYKHE